METELVRKIENEAKYQLKFYKNIHLADKRNSKILLILFSTLIVCLFAIHVNFFLKIY